MQKAVLLQINEKIDADSRRLEPVESAIYFSLVVPIFNEEESVVALIDAISNAFVEFDNQWELLLVDDGSSDRSVALARQRLGQLTLNARVIQLSRNYGQTAAMQAGIDHARGKFIVTMDGDLQNDPRDIPMMLETLIDRDLDLLVGWRQRRQDNWIFRKLPSLLANRLIGRVSGVSLHDYGCSLKVYRSEVIKQVKLVGEMHRFIPLWVASLVPASRIGEIPVRHHARQYGKSKYGISRTIRVVLDLLSVMFFKRYLGRPGHFFGAIGMAIGALGMLVLAYLGMDKFVLGNDIGTRPMLLVGFVSVLMSLQFVTTGILAEMMSRTYFDSSQTNYFIRGIYNQDKAQ